MAFRRYKNKASVGMEYMLMADKEGCNVGEALKVKAGRLTKCDPTDIPEFISVCKREAATTSIEEAAVERVMEDIEYEVTSTEDIAETLRGSKVTLSDTAEQITATTESGVFAISNMVENKIRGYFRR